MLWVFIFVIHCLFIYTLARYYYYSSSSLSLLFQQKNNTITNLVELLFNCLLKLYCWLVKLWVNNQLTFCLLIKNFLIFESLSIKGVLDLVSHCLALFLVFLFLNPTIQITWLILEGIIYSSWFFISLGTFAKPLISVNTVYLRTAPAITSIQFCFILLTLFLVPLALFSNWNDLKHQTFNIKYFLLLISSLTLLIILSFSTNDLFLFVVFFESTSLPLFLLIGFFGHRSKKYRASWYLLLYTLFGSIFLLGSVVLVYSQYQTTNLLEIAINYQFKFISQERLNLIYLGLLIGFAIKIPMFPFHMWLPEAHVEAPTSGSILLAGVLLKLGGYGLIYFLLPFFNLNTYYPLVAISATLGIVYSSFILFRETHLKKIIAYSSIVHMNLGVFGLFSQQFEGVTGALFMMFSHGFISSGLFFCAGVIFNRFKTYDITSIKGLANYTPKLVLALVILLCGNIGLPLTAGFVGEFFVLVGVFKTNRLALIIVILGLFLNTVYNLLLIVRVCYGNFNYMTYYRYNLDLTQLHRSNSITYYTKQTQDLSRLETLSLSLFCSLSVVLGVYPQFIIGFLT